MTREVKIKILYVLKTAGKKTVKEKAGRNGKFKKGIKVVR